MAYMKPEDVQKIKVGDKLWIGNHYKDRARVVTVERLTNSLVVISKHERYNRTGDSAAWQYGMSGVWNSSRIAGFASKTDVVKYEIARAAEIKAQQKREEKHADLEEQRKELQDAFEHDNIYVAVANEHDVQTKGADPVFSLNLTGLSADEVKRITKLLKR